MDRRLPVSSEHERRQETPNAAVAIAKGVDRFELDVRDRCPHEYRNRHHPFRLVAQERCQVIHQPGDFGGRRRNVARNFQAQPDMVLDVTKLPRHGVRMALHQHLMQRTNQGPIQGHDAMLLHLCGARHVGAQVGQGLRGIGAFGRASRAGLEFVDQQAVESGACPFDLAAVDGFSPVEHGHQQFCVFAVPDYGCC